MATLTTKKVPQVPAAAPAPAPAQSSGATWATRMASGLGTSMAQGAKSATSTAQGMAQGSVDKLTGALRTAGAVAKKALPVGAAAGAPSPDFSAQATRAPKSYQDLQGEFSRLGLQQKLTGGGQYGGQDAAKRLSSYNAGLERYKNSTPEQIQNDWRANYLFRRMQQDAYRNEVLQARQSKGDVGKAQSDYRNYLAALELQRSGKGPRKVPAAPAAAASGPVPTGAPASQAPVAQAQAPVPARPAAQQAPQRRVVPSFPSPTPLPQQKPVSVSPYTNPSEFQRMLLRSGTLPFLDRNMPNAMFNAVQTFYPGT